MTAAMPLTADIRLRRQYRSLRAKRRNEFWVRPLQGDTKDTDGNIVHSIFVGSVVVWRNGKIALRPFCFRVIWATLLCFCSTVS